MSAVDEARSILANARFTFVLTGAGVSAESGIPTFRGAGGFWRNLSFQQLATPDAFAKDPALVWTWYGERRAQVLACSPNAAHVALATWSKTHAGRLVTQNVDGLHERAGHEGVVRFHGSLFHSRCTRCGKERFDEASRFETLPKSPCCGALERPGVVWFGEAIPERAAREAEEAIGRCDALLVVGTSGVVWPAAGFVHRAKDRGAKVIEVNPDDTELPSDVAIRSGAAAAVPAILGVSR